MIARQGGSIRPNPTIVALALWLPLGCTGSPASSTEGDDVVPEDTGHGAMATGACAVTSHPLVFDCRIELEEPSPLTLSVTSEHATARAFESPEARVHDIRVWGLQPETSYTWAAGPEEGTLFTGALPSAFDEFEITVQGELFAMDAVLIYTGCGYFAMVENDGDVVWFTEASLYDGLSDGMMWSQADRTMLSIRDSAMGTMRSFTSALEEVDLLGNVVLSLAEGQDYEVQATHDVGRWRGYTYLLAEAEDEVGGFEVFDGTTSLGQWFMSDAFGSLPGTHVNGLSVSEAGEVVISDLPSHTVIAVDGDPASPTFLTKRWHASGSVSPALADPDYRPTEGVVFQAQHNASRHGDELWVFDNRSRRESRALRLAMDHEKGTLTELDSWSVGRRCAIQGGALPIEGGALATCANAGQVSAFRDGADVADWTMQSSCEGRSGFTRGFPVHIQ